MGEGRINIAIDGYAGVGKSTTARRVAAELGYTYVDTGAMYRAVTWHLLQQNISVWDTAAVAAELPKLSLTYDTTHDPPQLALNGRVLGREELRSAAVSAKVSEVAAHSPVRQFLVAQQTEMGKQKGVVMDGRDIGTVVLPDAELKVFVVAGLDTRVERRRIEIQTQGDPAHPDMIRDNLEHRDRIDSSRADSPLRRADDAKLLDTTDLAIHEQVAQVVAWAQEVITAVGVRR